MILVASVPTRLKPPPDDVLLQSDVQEALAGNAPDEAARAMLVMGYTYGQIARACGYESWQKCRRAIEKLLRAEVQMQRDLRQQVEMARLVRLEKKLQPQVEAGNVEAIRAVLEVSRERRKLMADDEPARQAPPPMPSLAELEQRLAFAVASQGNDPQPALAHFRRLAIHHGYLAPTVVEGEVVVQDGEDEGAAPPAESSSEGEDVEPDVEEGDVVVVEVGEE